MGTSSLLPRAVTVPRFGAPASEAEADLRWLRCHAAVLERELRALREDNEAKALRIAALEQQLYEMRNKYGNLR